MKQRTLSTSSCIISSKNFSTFQKHWFYKALWKLSTLSTRLYTFYSSTWCGFFCVLFSWHNPPFFSYKKTENLTKSVPSTLSYRFAIIILSSWLSTLSTLSTFKMWMTSQKKKRFSFEKGCAIILTYQKRYSYPWNNYHRFCLTRN